MDLDLLAPIAAICALLIIMVIFMHVKARQRRRMAKLEYVVPRHSLNGHSSTSEWERAVERSLEASKERRGETTSN